MIHFLFTDKRFRAICRPPVGQSGLYIQAL
jgi:hypothetical protein